MPQNGSFFTKIKHSLQTSQPIVIFIDWQGCYALFSINSHRLTNEHNIRNIIVACEGDWTTEDSMFCYNEFKSYEDVQACLGCNLTFLRKEYVRILNRTFVEYTFDVKTKNILAIPASGEELSCEIYAKSHSGALFLLYQREI